MALTRRAARAVVVAAAVAAGACGQRPSSAGVAASPRSIAGRVADREITLAEVDEHALGVDAGTFSGLPLRLALFESRRRALDELVAQELFAREARTRGVKPDALVQQEVLSRVAAVQDSEIEAWYRDNPDRVRGASLEQVRETIRQYLRQQRVNQASAALIARLKAATRVEILLEPPRVSVSVPEGAPTLGPAQAPVQIVEFSDFQCPYCAQVAPVLRALPGTYGDKVRIIFRNFPLVIHPQAVGAAEAAQCAHVQGKFWEYHDRLFANQQALGPDDLKRQAATVGLDASAFGACLDGHTFAGAVEADAREAQRYGVSATPTFFINGRFVSGALSREAFQQIIDEELGRAGK